MAGSLLALLLGLEQNCRALLGSAALVGPMLLQGTAGRKTCYCWEAIEVFHLQSCTCLFLVMLLMEPTLIPCSGEAIISLEQGSCARNLQLLILSLHGRCVCMESVLRAASEHVGIDMWHRNCKDSKVTGCIIGKRLRKYTNICW